MSEIENIKEKLKEISEILNDLEGVFSRTGEDTLNIGSSMLRVVRKLVDLYYIVIDYIAGEEEIYKLTEGDDIKTWIIKSLYQYGRMNISQLTKAIKERRGKASRRIIAKKLDELEEKSIVKREIRGKNKIYYLNI